MNLIDLKERIAISTDFTVEQRDFLLQLVNRAPVVHILRHGHARCMFTAKLPKDWPAGHVWTGDDEAHLATCADCLARHGALSKLPKLREGS